MTTNTTYRKMKQERDLALAECERLNDTLDKLVADFKKGFATTDGSSVVPDAHVAAMDEADVEKEAVQVRKPAPKKK